MTTTAPAPEPAPVHDSILEALGIAFRVLGKAGFLWAPILLTALQTLPLAFMPGLLDPSAIPNDPAEIEAFFAPLLPTIALSILLGLILGPIGAAVAYRLAQQFLDGEEARPFGDGLVSLAWRLFLQAIALTLLFIVAALAFVAVVLVLEQLAGLGRVLFLVGAIVGVVVGIVVALRLAIAPPLLLQGQGPIESLRSSWRLTSGRLGVVFRWLFVSGLLVGLVSLAISAIVGGIFSGLGRNVAGQLLAGAVVAPLSVVTSIVLILLARLLSQPAVVPPAPPALPEWMGPPPAVAPGAELPDWMTPKPPTPAEPPPPTAPPPPGTPPADAPDEAPR
jgi:hypothetical protein